MVAGRSEVRRQVTRKRANTASARFDRQLEDLVGRMSGELMHADDRLAARRAERD
jgi:hypothetical protein